MKRILITGGAGFIGSHLAERLVREGNEVRVIDDLSTGRLENVAHLEKAAGFRCFVDSILNEKVTEQLVIDCDEIYHLAAAVGVRLIVEEPIRTIETNVAGTETMLKLAWRYRKKILITSTSEVYGKSRHTRFREEDDSVIGPPHRYRWAYAASKSVDEFLGLAYWTEKKLPVVIVRLFNTIGPRQSGQYGMVVPRFIKQALAGEPITVHGDGRQVRCFTYVDDVVESLLRLMRCRDAVGEVVNVGNPEAVTISRLAKMIRELTGSGSKIIFIPYEKAYGREFEDMRRRVPDIGKLKKLTGFTPLVGLEKMLVRTIAAHQGISQKSKGKSQK